MKWVALQVRAMRAAMVSLTRLPIGGFPYSGAELRWASAYFPLVGMIVGTAMALTYRVSLPASATVAAFLAIAVGVLLTGAYHEDGLADTADALGGAGTDRQRIFEILKDSRIGSFGALALFLSIGIRAAALSALGTNAPIALLLTQCLSRVSPVWIGAALPYVTPVPVARSGAIASAAPPQVAVASLWGLLAVASAGLGGALGLKAALALVAVVVTCTVTASLFFWQRARGSTGDFLGAAQQITECGLLLTLAAIPMQ